MTIPSPHSDITFTYALPVSDPADQLRVDEYGAVGQDALRVLFARGTARLSAGAGARARGASARMEVRQHRGRPGRLRREGEKVGGMETEKERERAGEVVREIA